MPNTSFLTLPLSNDQLSNLESLDFKTITAVQAKSLPPILEGKDCIVQAKTGEW